MDPLAQILNDPVAAGRLRTAYTMLKDIDPAVLDAARQRLDTCEAVGPMMDPTAYLDGTRFDRIRAHRELFRLTAPLCAKLREVIASEAGDMPIGGDA